MCKKRTVATQMATATLHPALERTAAAMPKRSDTEARVVLAMWFTADVRHREDDSDWGYRCGRAARARL